MIVNIRTCQNCIYWWLCVTKAYAYQEPVALKRQEELIREEEAAGLLENDTKGKRSGGVNEKDKRAKKKQVTFLHVFSS